MNMNISKHLLIIAYTILMTEATSEFGKKPQKELTRCFLTSPLDEAKIQSALIPYLGLKQNSSGEFEVDEPDSEIISYLIEDVGKTYKKLEGVYKW